MQVFLRLPADARARAASVCHVWHDAAVDPAVRAVLHFSGCRVAMTDVLLAALCGRAGKALRELHLDATQCNLYGVTAGGIVTTLRAGGCTQLRRLVMHRSKPRPCWSPALTLKAAKQLAAALPKVEHVDCIVDCENRSEVAHARASLPGPVKVRVNGVVVEAGRNLPAQHRGPAAVRAIVDKVLRDVLGPDVIVDSTTHLLDYGLDSLAQVELTHTLERELLLELSGTLLFDYPTVDAVVSHLATFDLDAAGA